MKAGRIGWTEKGEGWRWWKVGGRKMKVGWIGWTEKGKDGRIEWMEKGKDG